MSLPKVDTLIRELLDKGFETARRIAELHGKEGREDTTHIRGKKAAILAAGSSEEQEFAKEVLAQTKKLRDKFPKRSFAHELDTVEDCDRLVRFSQR